ncbi:hypothetical protein [Variovorax saccharolyticus]|uniref:hypothetical protein n=1 Tax=Variovorax saccharolyticus TaxID=3053516 RepID=UPI0025751C02|nr:hypothetical protein [Variovorax sp. J31P216]MDM0026497.1 hypothetical protein [Variovorax sp. J31P216]
MPAPTDWQSAPHPSMPGFFCLKRFPHVDRAEFFGNRLGTAPKIEAFASREQAERVAERVNYRSNASAGAALDEDPDVADECLTDIEID